MKSILFITLLVGLVSVPAHAQEVFSWGIATITTEAGTTPCSLFVCPNGRGMPFTEARVSGGAVIDATVRLLLTDFDFFPIVGVPAEDMWLETSAGGMVRCINGTSADGPTDANGIAVWIEPLEAGGHSEGETMHGWVSGERLSHAMPITVNSADINGSLVVDLSDIVEFIGPYHYKRDFNFDTLVTLTDIVMFVACIGAMCP